MRRTLILSLLICFAATMWSQSLQKVSDSEAAKMISAINSATSSMKTIQCKFSQEKKVSLLKDKIVSSGKMYYASGGKLRWEYTKPYSYIFVINNNVVTTKSGNRKNSIDVATNKLFQNITRIMVNSVTGKSLSNNKDYSVTMYKEGSIWVAHLVPKDANMKKMFKYIRLYLNANHSMVSKVEMVEKNGDSTLIKLYDIETNKTISDKVFIVN